MKWYLKWQKQVCVCVFVCELTLSNNILNNLNGLVKLSNLNLHWVGPHLSLLGNMRGQRSDCKQLKLNESHAEEFNGRENLCEERNC